MKFYQTLQCTVGCDADLHLPEFQDHAMPDLLVRKRRPRDRWPDTVAYFKEIRNGDTMWVRFGRSPEGFVMEFPGYVTFLADAGFREVVYVATASCLARTLDHFILDQAIPLVLSGRGLSILHCAAVHLPQGIVAFLGPSGFGKSTLATSFARQGFPLAGDDCLAVRQTAEGYVAAPSYPGVRLWDPSLEALFPEDPVTSDVAQFTSKRRVSDRHQLPFLSSPARLKGLYVLDPSPDERMRIEPLTGAAAVSKLFESSFLMTDQLEGPMRTIFSTLAGLASAGMVFRLAYPEGLDRLAAVRSRVLQHVAA
jgi:hypothetical protein